jgi:hypothetical protein
MNRFCVVSAIATVAVDHGQAGVLEVGRVDEVSCSVDANVDRAEPRQGDRWLLIAAAVMLAITEYCPGASELRIDRGRR